VADLCLIPETAYRDDLFSLHGKLRNDLIVVRPMRSGCRLVQWCYACTGFENLSKFSKLFISSSIVSGSLEKLLILVITK
jgi:hypothetical protein